MSKRPLSRISALHYFKLCFRSVLFVSATIMYIYSRVKGLNLDFTSESNITVAAIWIAIGLIFVIEMILRFFPSRLESMGCQKQFLQNYKPVLKENIDLRGKMQSGKSTFLVIAFWIALNLAVFLLYAFRIIDEGILLLLSLAYSVCDMICILFFCPFQTWIMKNKCCGSCRIYNWDYAMMFTPLIFIPSIYTWTLLALAIALLLRWEIAYRLHPERFYEVTNENLSCMNCNEKLCHHKKQLQKFLKKNFVMFGRKHKDGRQ